MLFGWGNSASKFGWYLNFYSSGLWGECCLLKGGFDEPLAMKGSRGGRLYVMGTCTIFHGDVLSAEHGNGQIFIP